jgi:hypothetical protein
MKGTAMFDYTTAALNEATVRLYDGSEVEIFYNPAGQNGWLEAVIGAYDPLTDDVIYWDLNGRSLGHDDHIVGVVE